ncbi:MAG: tail fiber domain-containing protein, partial [Bacteroidales bacterium]|nr:tail fiber domain-containing protein [Bacteroidales bacterium]
GEYAGFNNLNGHNNVYMGYSCGKKNTVGSWNVFLGNEAGRENLDGNRNIAIGCNAFMNNLSGENNIALGYYAMSNNINGFNNIALGNGSLSNNINGNSNIGLGASSLLKMKNGTNNICIGFAALMTDTSGNYNTCIGDNVMIYSFGNGNVAVGNVALNKNIGNHNTAVGNAAFNNPNAPTNFENSTAIGFESYITASNQVRIGNAFVTSIGGFQNWTNISDKRFKQEINENVPGLAFIMKLKPVTYKLNYREIANYLNKKNYADLNSTNLQTGFIAQDVEKAANELGFEFSGIDKPKNEKDYYGLRYAEFTVPLVKAVQEQQLQIEQLKNENKALKEEINKIKKSLNK